MLFRSGQDNVYYYSRIMQTDGKAAAKVVEFAKKFHDETFIKDDLFPSASSVLPRSNYHAAADPHNPRGYHWLCRLSITLCPMRPCLYLPKKVTDKLYFTALFSLNL